MYMVRGPKSFNTPYRCVLTVTLLINRLVVMDDYKKIAAVKSIETAALLPRLQSSTLSMTIV